MRTDESIEAPHSNHNNIRLECQPAPKSRRATVKSRSMLVKKYGRSENMFLVEKSKSKGEDPSKMHDTAATA